MVISLMNTSLKEPIFNKIQAVNYKMCENCEKWQMAVH